MGAGWVKDRYKGVDRDLGGQNWWTYLPAAGVAAVDTFNRFLHPRVRALELRTLWLGTGRVPTTWLGIEGLGESWLTVPARLHAGEENRFPERKSRCWTKRRKNGSGMAPNNWYPWWKLMTSQDPHLVCQLYLLRLLDTFEGLLELDYNLWWSLFPSRVYISEDFFR